MVITSEHQPCLQYPAWDSPNSNCVSALLQIGQQVNLPFTANAVSPELHGSPNVETALQNGNNGGFLPMLLPHSNVTMDQYPREVMPTDASGPSQKKFLIFDQSGDQTRLFIGPSFCKNELLSKKTIGDYGSSSQHENTSLPINPIVEEQSNESEMHEDSEDINALLYSDSDDEDDDDDDDDDEVTSTDHSPFTEHIASSDGPSKRQRLFDGGYKESANLPLTRSNEDDAGSSCSGGQESDPGTCRREKKTKIRQTLRNLQELILGINSNDPLLVIDEAINYLKLLRMKVKDMGV